MEGDMAAVGPPVGMLPLVLACVEALCAEPGVGSWQAAQWGGFPHVKSKGSFSMRDAGCHQM